MLDAILCYNDPKPFASWPQASQDAVMEKLEVIQRKLTKEGRLGPVARLSPATAAKTLRKDREPLVIDDPFAETKEQLLGFYMVSCSSIDEAIEIARDLGQATPLGPMRSAQSPAFERERFPVADIAWIDLALTSARPKAVAALLRYFHDLDTAEEAYQEACLSALKTWPDQGPPSDPAAWLIFVGRNSGIDAVRRRGMSDPLADLGFLILWPGIGVMFSYQTANDPSHLVDSFQLAYWVLLIFAGFVVALFQTAWKSPSRAAVLFAIALVGGMCSIGLANAVNALPDKATPRLYQTLICSLS